VKEIVMRTHGVAALAAFSLVAAPVAAAAAPPTPVTAPVQVGETTDGSGELVGTTAWILAAIALGLIVWGIIELSGDDGPSSP
jgi:hypothetical protein